MDTLGEVVKTAHYKKNSKRHLSIFLSTKDLATKSPQEAFSESCILLMKEGCMDIPFGKVNTLPTRAEHKVTNSI
jgi:hypothetical protein